MFQKRNEQVLKKFEEVKVDQSQLNSLLRTFGAKFETSKLTDNKGQNMSIN